MDKYFEKIENYLLNQMDAKDKAAFEAELRNNADLRKELELQQDIMKGVERFGLSGEVKSGIKKAKFNKLMKTLAIGVGVATLAALAAWYGVKKNNAPEEHLKYQMNESGKAQWSEPDKQLESQFFKINPKRDTLIETRGGIIFELKTGVFLDKFGENPKEPVEIEVKEAMTAADIINAGLSTTSDGKLLETGGMFYINARQGKDNLDIDQSREIKVHVPALSTKEMSLFEGKREEDGGINWVNPRPMKRNLPTVDIRTLDFYPPHFLDSLKVMGFDVKNRKLTDSIYYSYSGYNACSEAPYCFPDSAISRVIEASGLSNNAIPAKPEKMQIIEASELSDKKIPAQPEEMQNAVVLRCYAVTASLTNKSLTPREEHNCIAEINPSRIRAIWDAKFNNTFLATPQFEERLKIIFGTCNPNLFDLYAHNLNRPLYELDSLAAFVYSGTAKERFLEFYKRREPGVSLGDNRNKDLQQYMIEKQKVYDKAVQKAMAKVYEAEWKKQEQANTKDFEHQLERNKKLNQALNEEIDLNLREAYKQLGKPEPPKFVAQAPFVRGYYSAPFQNLGWKNVDAYVFNSTLTRSTLNYKDPDDGKTAKIEYKPITVKIKNREEFDRVVCYLLPDKLSTFQLMKDSGAVFKENLNENVAYSLIVVGFKGEQPYYNDVKYASAKEYELQLNEIDKVTLESRINSRYNWDGTMDIIRDIDFSVFNQQEKVRKEKYMTLELQRQRIFKVIFPCFTLPH